MSLPPIPRIIWTKKMIQVYIDMPPMFGDEVSINWNFLYTTNLMFK